MLSIIDYGVGNVQAFVNIYKRLDIAVRLVRTADELCGSEKIILPGVGSFDSAMRRLEASGMRGGLDDLVLRQERPVLGICVGMQMMARRSEEGNLPGLGWFDAEVRRFDVTGFRTKTRLPHMGWNDVKPIVHKLFGGLETSRFYFLHSYYFAVADSSQTLAITDYNGSFTSAVWRGNIFGVQFHPEKSHQWGVRLLKNFAEI